MLLQLFCNNSVVAENKVSTLAFHLAQPKPTFLLWCTEAQRLRFYLLCVLQLPGGLLQERDKRAKWHGIPVLLQKLYESSHPNSDFSHAHNFLKVTSLVAWRATACRHHLPRVLIWCFRDVEWMQTSFFSCQVLSSQLSMDAMSFVTEDRKTAQESTFPNTHTFDLFGGVDVSLMHWSSNMKPIVFSFFFNIPSTTCVSRAVIINQEIPVGLQKIPTVALCFPQKHWSLLFSFTGSFSSIATPTAITASCYGHQLHKCLLTALNCLVSLQLLVEILMRPTLTMQKKKTQSKQRWCHFCERFCHDNFCHSL